MADSNNRDHPEIVEAGDPDRPDPDQTEAAYSAPSAPGRAWATRRTLWGSSLAAVAIAAAITAVTLNEGGGSHRPDPSPTAPSGAATPTRPSAPALPLSAVHDAHGLIVTLPDIRRILGPTPLPGVTLSENRLIESKLGDVEVTQETNDGSTNSATEFRAFSITLIRFPSTQSIKHDYGSAGPAPYRQDAHNWIGPSTHISGLGAPGIVYQSSTGPYKANIPNESVNVDYVGPEIEARYRNVTIDISFESADYHLDKSRQLKVVYPPYDKTQGKLVAIARKIVAHL